MKEGEGKRIGVSVYRGKTYRKAGEEGWSIGD
jgi:hypothetical protein